MALCHLYHSDTIYDRMAHHGAAQEWAWSREKEAWLPSRKRECECDTCGAPVGADRYCYACEFDREAAE